MRVVAPIGKWVEWIKEQLFNGREANLHSTWDVKYTTSDGKLCEVYVYTHRGLNKKQLEEAITQVYDTVLTFGYSYSSTELSFPVRD